VKNKNIEMKIYEFLGVKTFRSLAYKLIYLFRLPFTLSLSKEEREKKLHSTPSNYNMKKGNGLQDLRDFKKMLLLNASLHIYSLFNCIHYLVRDFSVIILFAVIINIYCIMLQRYNHIRINQILKKGEGREQRQKEKILEELRQNEYSTEKLAYKFVNKRDEELNISFEQFLETATLQQLKDYKKALEFAKVEYDYLKFLEKYDGDNKVPIGKSMFIKLILKSQEDLDKTLKK